MLRVEHMSNASSRGRRTSRETHESEDARVETHESPYGSNVAFRDKARCVQPGDSLLVSIS